MFCPNCGSRCEDFHRFCIHCGTQLPTVSQETEISESIAEEIPVPPEPIVPEVEGAAVSSVETAETELPPVIPAPAPQKKGRLWPPLLIMGIMVCLGLVLFFATKGMSEPGGEYAWFSVRDGALYFDESRYTGGPELTVPQTVDGKTVIALSPGCFAECEKLTIIYLPDTLVTVGSGAFSGCTAMRGILLPEGVTTVGADAFSGCISLEAICVPTTVNAIGSGAFDRCESLCYIMYPGAIRDWQRLYGEYINDQAEVYCAEGIYPHQFAMP